MYYDYYYHYPRYWYPPYHWYPTYYPSYYSGIYQDLYNSGYMHDVYQYAGINNYQDRKPLSKRTKRRNQNV